MAVFQGENRRCHSSSANAISEIIGWIAGIRILNRTIFLPPQGVSNQ
jgi:hypothetical protein